MSGQSSLTPISIHKDPSMHAIPPFLSLILALSLAFAATTAVAQDGGSKPDQGAEDTKNSLPTFPVPTKVEGAALLQAEQVAFTPKSSSLPNIATVLKAAQKGDVPSQFIAHMMYRDRIGDVAHYDNGKKVNKKLSDAEIHREMIRWRDASVEALYDLSMLAAEPTIEFPISDKFHADANFKKGLDWLEKAAANGYGNAEYVLGLVYWNGLGVAQDKDQGFALLVRAAAHGVINAYYHIGMIYELGRKGQKDPDKALFWLEKAAHFGSKDAIFTMAVKYADGIGVPEDPQKSAALRKLDPRYHAWTQLLALGNVWYHRYCTFHYDASDIGWTETEGGGCEGTRIVYNDDFSKDGDDDDEDDEESEDLDEAATFSLDYKLDYRLAGTWLTEVADIDRANSYILRSQTRHITGCRGRLDGSKATDILIYSEDEYDGDDANNYDDAPDILIRSVIAVTDFDESTEKVRNWIERKAQKGDAEASFLMGVLHEQCDEPPIHKEVYDSYSSVCYDPNGSLDPYDVEEQYENWIELLKPSLDLKKAFSYYEKAKSWDDACRAAIAFADEAKSEKREAEAAEWYGKAFSVSQSQYLEAVAKFDKVVASGAGKKSNAYRFAQSDVVGAAHQAGDTAYIAGDEAKAYEWYNIALEHDAGSRHAMRMLAKIYLDGAPALRNPPKAIDLYKKLYELDIEKEPSVDVDTTNIWVAIAKRLGDLYDHGTDGIPVDHEIATRWYQLAYELNDDVDSTKERIVSMPKLELQNDVEGEILAEKGKDPDGFFVIDKVLSRCEYHEDPDDDDGEEDYEYECDQEFLKSMYNESIQKAMTAITALAIATGQDQNEIIQNTFYYFAVYLGNNGDYRSDLREMSPVWKKLYDLDIHGSDRDYLFFIWYLRQIPYAAKYRFSQNHDAKKWNDYMAQAKKRIKQDKSLRTAFGYNLLQEIQPRSVEVMFGK